MRAKRFFMVVIAAFLVSIFVIDNGIIFATEDDEPTSSPPVVVVNGTDGHDHYSSGCPPPYNQCTGATWVYVPWTPGKTSETIDDGAPRGDIYKTHVFSDWEVQTCSEAGGYYRYSMINQYNGTPHGIMMISGYDQNWKNSTMLGGGMPYRGRDKGGEDWNDVKNAFEAARELYGDDIGEGFVPGSTMMIFCASYNGTPTNPVPNPTPEVPGTTECPNIAEPDAWTKSGPNEGWSAVRTRVKNNTLGTRFEESVYAKPGDSVTYRHCYFPGAQKTANSLATYYHKNHDNLLVENDLPSRTFPNKSAKISNSVFGDWTNKYHIDNRAGGHDDLPGLGSYGVGDDTIRSLDNNWSVDQSWVGEDRVQKETSSLVGTPWYVKAGTYNEEGNWDCHYMVLTNEGSNYSSCTSGGDTYTTTECVGGYWFHPPNSPDGYQVCANGKVETVTKQCKESKPIKCTHGTGEDNNYYAWEKKNKVNQAGDESQTASVLVPYNYNVSGNAILDGDVVYAGETASIKYGQVYIYEKYNGTTRGIYLTDSGPITARFVTFVSSTADGSNPITEKRVDSNTAFSGSLTTYNRSVSFNGRSVNVDDTEAGNYFCVSLWYTPTSSGDDKNMFPNGTGEMTSVPDCKIIAKRPSFQVLGGSLYSTGAITTGRAAKNNLKGVVDYKITGVSSGNVFGSWDELSVVSVGIVDGFASGAATADSGRNNSGAIGYGNREESTTNGFCRYESILTFSNYAGKKATPICGGTNNNVAGGFATKGAKVDKVSYIENAVGSADIIENVTKTDESSFSIGVAGTYAAITSSSGKPIIYTRADHDITLEASNIQKGKTYIIDATENHDVTIEGNIEYSYGDGEYSDLEDIPKVLIYAKNIKINCGVDRVDAALIAEGDVNTCTDADADVNDGARSNQLQINGTVITKTLSLGRTYGAATGEYSSVPAEIINYDTTLVLWARAKADTSESGNYNVTYTRELAPRY